MRTVLGLLAGSLVVGVAGVALNACGHDCSYTLTCEPPDGWDDASDGNVVDGSQPHDAAQDVDASAIDAGRDGDALADVVTADAPDGFDAFVCPPTAAPKDQGCVVDEKYGVFVSPTGDDTAAGTRAKPMKTWGAAMDKAKADNKSDVFACGGTYVDPLDVGATRDGLHVYGGLRCADWQYDATAIATIAPSVPGIALTVRGLTTGLTLTDVNFVALDGVNAGDSSIAVFVAQSQGVSFERATLTAGKGITGAAGGATSNFNGVTAQDGQAPSGITGGAGGQATCTNGNTSTGGNGGSVVTGVGANGTTGASNPPQTTTPGHDGAGGTGGATACGVSPFPGVDGAGGIAASGATRWGTLNAASWTPERGHDGSAGNPGQGGGGGGAKATPPTGGGGGGAGGCGGGGGGGGAGGGSSFALLSYQAFVGIKASALSAGDAGKGGDGAAGQLGQGGGGAALAVCGGNYGGNGAGGSAGGGGAGGVSVAVGFLGNAPALDAASTTNAKTGTAGEGGSGITVAASGGTNALGTGAPGAVSTDGRVGQTKVLLDLQ